MRKLPLHSLADRHPGLTPPIADSLCEAASICLSRHLSPPSEITLHNNDSSKLYSVEWPEPDLRTTRAWANDINATELGACGVSLVAVEMERGLVTIGRAETRTGADYYIAPPGHSGEDFEDCIRLEVSGVDKGNQSILRSRLSQKVKQAQVGNSNLPAIAAVVGFAAQSVIIADVEDRDALE